MRPDIVVVGAPVTNDAPGVGQVGEPIRIQAFFAKAPIEALSEAVVGRLSRSREVERDVVDISPLVQRLAGEFRAVVVLQRRRPRQRRVDLQRLDVRAAVQKYKFEGFDAAVFRQDLET